jgi:hypothetical protein
MGVLGSGDVSQDKLIKAMENLTNSTTTLPSTIIQVIRLVVPQVLLLPTERKSSIGATKNALDNVTTKAWNEEKGNDLKYMTPKNALDVLGELLPCESSYFTGIENGLALDKSVSDAEAIAHVCVNNGMLFFGRLDLLSL